VDGDEARVVFMGSPDFAVPTLRALVQGGFRVVLVVTQPDKPAGRKQIPRPPAVKGAAQELGLEVAQPESVNVPEFVQRLRTLEPEAIVVAAFGQILSPEVLAVPSHACLNVHASLLPRWRGASPIQHAIIHGDEVTGVTIMHMTPALDAGDIVAQRETPIGLMETAGDLFQRLAVVGADLLLETLPEVLAGAAPRRPQDDSQATYAPLLRKRDGEVNWEQTARRVHDFIRGMDPWPGAFTHFRGQMLKLWRSKPLEHVPQSGRSAGEVIEITEEGLKVVAGVGLVCVGEVQYAGRRRMSASDWARGAKVTPGCRLGKY